MEKRSEAAETEVKIWCNSWQRELLMATQRIKANICGRGVGKTTAIGMKNYERVIKLPRGSGFLSSATYQQILNNSVPAMERHWNKCGLVEYNWKTKQGHYVIGQKPPVHFDKPLFPPRQYEHVITFFTGLTIYLFSMDRSAPNRGGNFNFGDIDEVQLLKREQVEQVLFPMIRGGEDYYGKNHHYNGETSLFGSMPWLDTGQWVLEYEEKAKSDPETFYFAEATAHCNLRALGSGWIAMQEKVLYPEVFAVEIMNERKMRAENQFYFNFSDERHVYVAHNTYKSDPNGRGLMMDQRDDYDPNKLIDISWDFGGWFTCALAFQQSPTKDPSIVIEKMFDSFYVSKGGSAIDVVDQFCDRYHDHKYKLVRLWGEPRGNNLSAYGNTLYEVVQKRFAYHGWQCEIKVVQTQAHKHDERYSFVNDILAENKNLPRLRCNRDTCKAPILSIKFTERTNDLKKDKSKERKRDFDQRHAPHFTDALDYFLMQKHYRPTFGFGMSAGTSSSYLR